MNNKVFSCQFNGIVPAAGGAYNQLFDMPLPNNTIKLKSIWFDVQINEQVSGIRLPIANQTTQNFGLQVGTGVIPGTIGDPFANFTAITVNSNGNSILLYRPQQLLFDSFFIRNFLQLNYFAVNNDILIAYLHHVAVVIEGEILEGLK